MPPERLQKILSNAGIASRREAEEWILEGRIMVNGKPATELGARADIEVDEVVVDGVPIDRSKYRYFMLNKPTGVITSASDDRGRPTVVDLVPIGDTVLHPVGRLDLDSEGLVLLTNDGHLTDMLTHPRNQVDKEYLVGVEAPVSKTDIERLVRGVESKGERLQVATIKVVAPPEKDRELNPEIVSWLMITLREGKNREIRRMMEIIGRQVLLLRRVRVASLVLGSLGNGAFRELEGPEVAALYRSALGSAKRAAQIEEARLEQEQRTPAERPRTAPPAAAPRTAPASSARKPGAPRGPFAARPPQGKPAAGSAPAEGNRADRRSSGGAGKADTRGFSGPGKKGPQATGRRPPPPRQRQGR